MVVAHVGHEVSAGDKSRALDDVLRSSTFARSERLKALLRYLCEAEMEGREAELTEYKIATSALGRPTDFSPLEDSSVRSRVYELRQRLEKFYAQEAPDSPLRIELRKGSYVPRFVLPFAEEPPAVAIAATNPAPAASPLPSRRIPLAAISFASGAVAMFAVLALWSAMTGPGIRVRATHLETTNAQPWTKELEAFWRPFTRGGTPLLIAFETH